MAELIEASSSSSSASSSRSSNYDVFLNFRGEDTRKNFTGFLDYALKNKGINVFIDNEELWTGEAIGPALLRAIQGSKICIPVFSKGYASSKWCLLELSKVLHCHQANVQLVLPVFLDVEPSDVRNQTGSFKGPFRKHEKNFKPQIVEGWRKALQLVGSLKGYVLKDDANGDQAKLVELVVRRVRNYLISSTQLVECKYRIGIDFHVNKLISLLDIDSYDVQFVGICGIGGIGKTTIAKAIYNRIHLDFNKHSFLPDVRERAAQCMGLASLQKQLLEDILGRNIDIADYHRGKKGIEQRLCREKVLLVFDDVDDKKQVDALVGELSWFGKGSRVIITSRDELILNMAKIKEAKIYRPQLFNYEESLQLFSLHAFSMDRPPEDFMQFAHSVAVYSDGLPLTLELLGSYLSNVRSKKVWKSTLQKWKKIPHEEVQRRLKISYDNLQDGYQKAIFLDAACFFIGWEKETIITIWEACGYHPESAIHRLITMSLLKFDGCYLRMHEQIRDMGRNIVKEENLMEPVKRSRLWCHDEILEVLDGHKGTDLEGMILPSNLTSVYPDGVYLDRKHFEVMSKLRFLEISSAKFRGEFSCLPFALRWLRWKNCPWDILPTNFRHERLVYLDLSMSNIKQAWNISPQDKNKRFKKLEVLDLSECRYLSKSPDFSWFPYLERLDLRCCYSLVKLDESIGQLSQLKSLILSKCWSLEELPESIGDLKSLVELKLNWSRIKALPNSVGLLEKLEVLDAGECNDLVKLPRSMWRMRFFNAPEFSGVRHFEETESDSTRGVIS
ncbi:disease resistance protein RUN1-like [Telopea speciosissima]|uniref:disease resistance protein RUN1-like n=1 Tax=Telopea speciosissima TaxID=54955 RepID=UPI001CC3C47D|nr:disease resistance protein RUN1-like [Telopea speciosissima]